MNRRQLITIILALTAVSAYAQQDNYTISGDLSPMVGILVKDTRKAFHTSVDAASAHTR